MMKQPLFGKDSSPQYTSRILGYAGTAVFWLIFFLVMLFAKPIEKKPKFKTVQIVLESTTQPLEKRSEAQAASAAAPATAPAAQEDVKTPVPETPAPKVEQPVKKDAPVVKEQPKPKTETVKKSEPVAKPKPAEPKKTEPAPKPKTVETKKTEPVKKAEPVKKSEPVKQPEPVAAPVLAKSVDDLMNEQLSQKKQKKEIDWDAMFGDDASDSNESSTSSAQTKKVTASNEFSGSVGTTTDSVSRKQSSSVSESNATSNATSNTKNALANVSNASADGKSVVANSNSDSKSVTSAGSGKVQIDWAGNQRRLIEPAEPVIRISEKNAALIDGSRTVAILFVVVESGNVPRGEIGITPESVLPAPVREEIKDQISKWRFEAADYASTAKFEYRIIKK